MKRIALFIMSLLFVATATNAQFYVSASGGYSLAGASARLGIETSTSGIKNVYGSYGEGLNTQFRAGYMINSTYGIELAAGYLHGKKQIIRKVSGVPGQPTMDLTAAARAYGLSLSLVYNFSENVYGRFGAVTKIGGQTVMEGAINSPLPTGATLDVDLKRHFKGKFPLGFIGALGYKHKLGEKLAIFGELEYMGISVKRDKSTLESFKATATSPQGTQELTAEQLSALIGGSSSGLGFLLVPETTYVDELPPSTNLDGSKVLSEKAPYSSFGINIGVSYSF